MKKLVAAQPAWRCNCRNCHHGTARKKIRVLRRKRPVYDEVRAFVLFLLDHPNVKPYGFTKEDLAVQLKVHVHFVEQALARLNREGLVLQPVHRFPHDCNRSPGMDHGPDSSWCGDIYRVRRRE